MKNFYKIIDKNEKKINFVNNRAQEHFEKNKHTRNIILKSRRLGFTTYECLDGLDDTLFSENFNALLIAHTKEDAIEIFDKQVSLPWKNIEKEFQGLWKLDADSANKLKFDFGNNCYSSIVVANSGRSGLYNRVHISEFAKLCAKYPQRATEIISGTLPTVPHNGRVDIESTAEGMTGRFYDMYIEAQNRKRPPMNIEFKAHFYNWTWDDEEIAYIINAIPTADMEEGKRFGEYQERHNLSDIEITYYYKKWLSLDKDFELLHQEYPTTPEEAFVTSGNTFFNKERLIAQIAVAPQPLKLDKGELPDKLYNHYLNGDLKIYEKPQDLIIYVMGADVAEGKNHDSSVANGINNKTLYPAFGFNSNKIRPDEFAELLDEIGRYYNNAYLAVESNTGLWVLTELNEKYAYPNLYWRERIDDVTHAVSKQLGYHTGTGSQGRKVMLDNLLVEVNNNNGVWVKPFLKECLTFIRNEQGRPEAAIGKHDDEVIATGICHYVRENVPAETKTSLSNTPKSLEEKIMARLAKKKLGNNTGINQSNYY